MVGIASTAPRKAGGLVHRLDAAVDLVVGLALVGELVVIIGNVIGRRYFDAPLLWSDEAAGFALSIIAFLGGAIAYRRDAHVRVQTVVTLLPGAWERAATALVDWMVLGIAGVTGYQSVGLLLFRQH